MNTSGEQCWYKILGVGRLASEDEIRKAYKRLALKFHPDKQTNEVDRKFASEVFCNINNAHEILSDPVQRKRYDEELEASRAKRSTWNSSQRSGGANARASNGHSKSSPGSQSPNGSSRQWNTHYASQGPGASYQRTSSKPQQQQSYAGGTWNSSSNNNRNQRASSGHQWNAHYQSQGTRQQRTNANSSSKSKQQSSARSNDDIPKPSSRSQSNRQKTSSANAHARQQRAGQSGSSQHRSPPVFGTCKATGMPCKHCILQGRYCFQHKHQDPSNGQGRHSSNREAPRPDDFAGQTVYGRNLNGQPCRRCMKQGGFCYQHKDQQPGGRQSESKKRSAADHSRTAYGVRADGEPCLRCMKQGRFCFQHVHQQV